MDLNSERGNVLLLEFSGQMALDESGLFEKPVSYCSPLPSSTRMPNCGRGSFIASYASSPYLSGTAIADEHELEGWGLALAVRHVYWWGGGDREGGTVRGRLRA